MIGAVLQGYDQEVARGWDWTRDEALRRMHGRRTNTGRLNRIGRVFCVKVCMILPSWQSAVPRAGDSEMIEDETSAIVDQKLAQLRDGTISDHNLGYFPLMATWEGQTDRVLRALEEAVARNPSWLEVAWIYHCALWAADEGELAVESRELVKEAICRQPSGCDDATLRYVDMVLDERRARLLRKWARTDPSSAGEPLEASRSAALRAVARADEIPKDAEPPKPVRKVLFGGGTFWIRLTSRHELASTCAAMGLDAEASRVADEWVAICNTYTDPLWCEDERRKFAEGEWG